MKIFYNSIYDSKNVIHNDQSIFQYIAHGTKQEKKGLVDSLVGIDRERLSFYHANKDNPRALLDAINFFEGLHGTDNNGDFWLGEGYEQIIPRSAIPRIKTESLPELKATNNKLCLSSKSYVSYTSKGGVAFACAVGKQDLGLAHTESMFWLESGRGATKDYKEMFSTASVIGGLIRDSINGLYWTPKADVRQALANVGIKPGKFSISVDGEERTYYLYENGKVITEKVALNLVDRYNRMNFLKGHSVGDEVTVFGRKYKIDEDGHIHVPTENFWVSGEFNTK